MKGDLDKVGKCQAMKKLVVDAIQKAMAKKKLRKVKCSIC